MTTSADELEAELKGLTLPHFNETTAFHLGTILVRIAEEEGLPVVINIRNGSRTFFHAALPGSSGENDHWARRKSNLTLMTNRASLVIGTKNRATGRTLDDAGLSPAEFTDSGGAVPLVVDKAGMVAVCTVSGLPQVEDHRLVLRGLAALIDDLG